MRQYDPCSATYGDRAIHRDIYPNVGANKHPHGNADANKYVRGDTSAKCDAGEYCRTESERHTDDSAVSRHARPDVASVHHVDDDRVTDTD